MEWGIKRKFMEITPKKASELLEHNTHNRKVKPDVVAKYASDMAERKWLYNGAAILIATDGTILDGQHRLLAVIKSGVPVFMDVIEGLIPETISTIDIGCPRGLNDILSLNGIPNGTWVGAALNKAYDFESEHPCTIVGKTKGLSYATILQRYNQSPSYYQNIVLYANKLSHNGNRVLRRSLIAGLLFYLIEKRNMPLEYIKTFLEGVCSLYASDNPAIEATRVALIRGASSGRKYRNWDTAILIVGWNAYNANKSISRIVIPADLSTIKFK